MTFKPYINRKVFKRIILDMLENEGGSLLVMNVLADNLTINFGADFYESFIYSCKNYQIDFEAIEVNGEFKIIINKNGNQFSTMTYSDKKKDVSENLARELFSLLSTEIVNSPTYKKL